MRMKSLPVNIFLQSAETCSKSTSSEPVRYSCDRRVKKIILLVTILMVLWDTEIEILQVVTGPKRKAHVLRRASTIIIIIGTCFASTKQCPGLTIAVGTFHIFLE